MKGVYLASGTARHPSYNIDYVDTDKATKPTILSDMKSLDLSQYAFVICSPPCNFWSHATSTARCSQYAKKTAHLLPWALLCLPDLGVPFIVENVKNKPKMSRFGIFKMARQQGLYVYEVGRHTYFTNVFCELSCKQEKDFRKGGICLRSRRGRQGGENVHRVIEIWLRYIYSEGGYNATRN